MNFSWSEFFWLYPHEERFVIWVPVIHVVVLILAEQNRFSRIKHVVTAMAPASMVFIWLWYLIGVAVRVDAQAVVLCVWLTVAMGLIYSVRCTRLPWSFFRWQGIFVSFFFFEMIVLPLMKPVIAPWTLGWLVYFFPSVLNQWPFLVLSSLLFLFGPPVAWGLILMRIDNKRLRKQRWHDYQCIACGDSLEKLTDANFCLGCRRDVSDQRADHKAQIQTQSTSE